jgi:hypothetical protein
MSKAFGIGFGAMAVILAIVIWMAFARTSGNHLVPTGSIGKVRTAKVADDVTFMVIDFNLKNDSDRDMVVRSVEAGIDKSDGSQVMGSVIAAADTLDALHTYTALGEQYNPPIKERDIVAAHQSVDRMVGIRLDVPWDQVDARKRVTLRVEDVTGPVAELTK